VKATNRRVFINGRFYTLDAQSNVAEAVAVQDGRIFAAGTTAEIRGLACCEQQVVNVEGRAVIPGLTDSHLHMLSFGQSLRRVNLSQVKSIAEMKRIVAEKVKAATPGGWVFGRGWDQDRLAELRYPTRYDLDEVAPANPVALTRSCGHIMVANSCALRLSGVDETTPDPPGGVIDRDEHGKPTGILREASGLVFKNVPEPGFDEMLSCLRDAMRAAVASGLTSVHPNDGADGDAGLVPELYSKLHSEGERLRVYWDIPQHYIDDIYRTGFRSGAGNEFFKYGSLKLLIDGSLGGATAALDGSYADDPGNQGVLRMSEQELAEIVERAHRAGMQVAIHAIGDRGVRYSLNAFEKAQASCPRPDPRHRIIHCQIMTREQYPRFARLGVVADIQPKFVTTDMLWAERRVGREKASTSYCWRTFLDTGVHAAGGSDCPVEPVEPMKGIYAAVTRKDMDGNPAGGWMPEQRLTVEQAIKLFAQGGPYAAFEEHLKGSLEKGRMADMVVLDGDPFKVDPDAIKDIKPVLTIIGGEIAYDGR